MRLTPSPIDDIDDEIDSYYNRKHSFNESIMILDQLTKISHKKYDIKIGKTVLGKFKIIKYILNVFAII